MKRERCQRWLALAWLSACTPGSGGADRPEANPLTTLTAAATASFSSTPAHSSPPVVPAPAALSETSHAARLPPLAAGGERVAHSTRGMVSSVEHNASRAGVEILQAGGNAVDAAVAVGYALAVTHPSAGNLGGGGFMLVKLRGQASRAFDFRERAPAALTQVGFEDLIKKRGFDPRASGVPGSVAGLNLAQRTFGRLPLDRVLAPAIRLARDGHALGKRQAQVLAWTWSLLAKDPAARSLFSRDGQPLKEGQRLVQPELARLLERIAAHGDAGFYAGVTAQSLANYMQVHSGWLTEADLQAYRAIEREPLHSHYRGFDVDVMPPPSAGGVAVVQMLQMLQAAGSEQWPPQSADGLHLFLEVAKRAHAERRFEVGDPDSLPGYDANARKRRWGQVDLWTGPWPIQMDRATRSKALHPGFAAASRELDDTTHFSVVDAEGNAVSCTTTLSGGFGAKYVVGDLGLVMNNSVAAFGTVGLNLPAPGRRMTSSMSPSILSYDGQLALVIGSPGGDTIPSTIVQVLRNLIEARQDLQTAIDAPRIHHGFVPDLVRAESLRALPAALRTALSRRGHFFSKPALALGDVNAVLVLGAEQYGYSDPREGGLALGAEP